MSRISVGGDIDVLTLDAKNKPNVADYSSWEEGFELTQTLKDGLDDFQLSKLETAISDQLSANMYYLVMRTNKDFSIFSKDTKFGAVYDIVDNHDKLTEMRVYFARLDSVLDTLYKKYSNNIVDISKLLQKEKFEVGDNFEFSVGEYTL